MMVMFILIFVVWPFEKQASVRDERVIEHGKTKNIKRQSESRIASKSKEKKHVKRE